MNEQTPLIDARLNDYELRVWQTPDGYLVFVGDYVANHEHHAFETWLEVLDLLTRIEKLTNSN